MKITQEQFTQLTRIYNTLMEVYTKGESSFIMTDCLRALEQTLTAIGQSAQDAVSEQPSAAVSETEEG